MLNDESFEKHVSQGDHKGNLKAADEDGFESDEEFVAVLGRVVDNPVPREEKAEDEAKKDDKDERTKKPDEAKSGKDVECKKVQGGANNGRPVKLANLNRDAYFLNIILRSSFPCTDVGFSEPLPNHKPISSAEGKEVTLTK